MTVETSKRDALVRQVVISLLVTEVELHPRRIEVEGNGIGSQVLGEDALEFVERNVTVPVGIENAKSDFEIGIGPFEQAFESDEFIEIEDTAFLRVGDAKEEGVLTFADLGEIACRCYRSNERIFIEIPVLRVGFESSNDEDERSALVAILILFRICLERPPPFCNLGFSCDEASRCCSGANARGRSVGDGLCLLRNLLRS